MKFRWFVVLVLVFGLSRLDVVFAHEGHVHRIMGTVSSVQENQLEVKATTGKASTILLNDKTKIVRGKAVMKPADVKAGTRVVVTATEVKGKDGRMSLVAKQVSLGTNTGAGKK